MKKIIQPNGFWQHSNKQKQEIGTYCQIAIAPTIVINSKIPYFKGLMDHYLNEYTYNKIKMSSPLTLPILIFVVYNNKSDNKEKEKEGEK